MDNDLMARRLRPPSEPTNPLDPFDVKSQVARNWQLAAPSTDAVVDESADAWDPPALSQGEVDAPWAATTQDAPTQTRRRAQLPRRAHLSRHPHLSRRAGFCRGSRLPVHPPSRRPLCSLKIPCSLNRPCSPKLPICRRLRHSQTLSATRRRAITRTVPRPTREPTAYARPDTYVELEANAAADAAFDKPTPEPAAELAFDDAPEFDHDMFARAAAAQFANAFASVFQTREPEPEHVEAVAVAPTRVPNSSRSPNLSRHPKRRRGMPQRRAMTCRGIVRMTSTADRHGRRRAACLRGACVGQAGRESWTDDVDAEDSPAPYAPSPNGRESDFDFPAGPVPALRRLSPPKLPLRLLKPRPSQPNS